MLELQSASPCDKLKKKIQAVLKDDGLTYRVLKNKCKHLLVYILNNEDIVLIDKRNRKNVHVHTGSVASVYKRLKAHA